jgi:hypothetical protein
VGQTFFVDLVELKQSRKLQVVTTS